jgi:hypothetical protein
MSERHVMGPIHVEPARRPPDWDAYSFQAFSHCTRCHQMLAMELMLPGRLMSLIPDGKRDEAMRVMADFTEARATHSFALAADGRVFHDDPELPLCTERKP